MIAKKGRSVEPTNHPNPIEIDKIICERLRARRLIMGISQAELGNSTGLSPQQIHKYESGVSRLTAGRLVLFASVLKVPLSYFYDGVESEQETPQRIINLLADPGTIELLQNYWKLPKAVRFATLAYTRVLAEEFTPTGSNDHETPAALLSAIEPNSDL